MVSVHHFDWIMKLWISYQPELAICVRIINSAPIQFIWFAQYNLVLGSSDLYSVVVPEMGLIGGDLVSLHHFD